MTAPDAGIGPRLPDKDDKPCKTRLGDGCCSGAGGSFASVSAPGSTATAFAPGVNGSPSGEDPAGDGQVTITALEQPQAVSATPGIGSATVSWTEPSQPPAAGPVTYAVYANGAPVAGATTSPAALTGLTPGANYSFTVVASTTDGLKTTSAAVTATPSAPPVPPKSAQTPARGCVTSGGATLPRKGTKTLMKANCRTNAGEIVGVKTVKANPKSKAKYTLFCQVTNRKTAGTRAASGGTRYCAKGELRVRTYGTRLSLRATWFARGNATFDLYQLIKTYR